MTQTSASARLGLPEDAPVDGLTTRFLTDDADYEPLSALIRACHEHDGVPWLPTADNVRLDMRQDGIDPARDVVLVALEGELVALITVQREVRDLVPTYDLWGKVAPRLRRRGIARWLLDWSLFLARERAAVEDPIGSVLLGAHVDERETGARVLYEQGGVRAGPPVLPHAPRGARRRPRPAPARRAEATTGATRPASNGL